ncbi:GNAT family N-acetyltransferase [Nonlabens marinus]|uniref:Acetyltransferase, GNAT family n=1 Tax=Nonlabens marinus S1-08 TaxID=1454201 RepID=W8VX06_9FLAO|nr:GNAT family N-acetyltransferase [Nonlabens marinus]BAO55182.1 acetyltransferase, GNAT family [Nonlabens marinus S1-08]
MPITIKEISALETYGVRHPVLRAGRPLEDCAMEGDELETTFHLGAYDDHLHVGVATFLKSSAAESPIDPTSNLSFYQLRGMGVIPDHQGKGIGKQLVERGIDMLKKNKVDALWFNARIAAVPFYERLGFSTIGSTFEVEHVGTHYKMYRVL